MLDDQLTFYDKDALLYRLHEGLEGSSKGVVFVVGAPLTAPFGEARGVADVDAVVELIRAEFSSKAVQLARLDADLLASQNRYQTAFDFLSGRAGQDAANRIVKQAVAQAILETGKGDFSSSITKLSNEDLDQLDRSNTMWCLSPAVRSLGQLVSRHSERFGRVVVTSNFDPLIEVAVRSADGHAWRTSLSSDGSLFQSSSSGCQVIHIHGYWQGSDTLHTNKQLLNARPTLANDLLTLLKDKIVVVIAYGGWPDIFMSALRGVVSNDNLMPEILWTFYGDKPAPTEYLQSTLHPGLMRNRVTLYTGIDCNDFFPELLALWDGQVPKSNTATKVSLETSEKLNSLPIESRRARLFKLSPLECDRPPNIDVWVGRENELRALETSSAKVVIVCGIGGEGKSALASHYISRLSESENGYRLWDWRDCKEQGDRLRTQITAIIVRFSEGRVTADDLTESDDAELIEVLVDQTRDASGLLVFDNVDSYVDLENQIFIGILDQLVQRFSDADTTSRLVFTCRPDVHYTSSSILTFSIQGISKDEAVELFKIRNPNINIPVEDIHDAREQTKGHAFWLDLLAVQISKVPGTTLRKQLNDMRRGRDNVPDVLSSIWDKLALREQTLLRLMAEAARPETEKTIEKFAASQLGYNQFNRAFRALAALNLIVVKQVNNAPNLFDLHPLVRQFVRNKFQPSQRAGFIRVVLNQYQIIIGTFQSLLGVNMPLTMLERWSEKVELEVSAGLLEDAFDTLSDAEDALIGGGHGEEYVRVARLLFEAIDWETAATLYTKFDRTVGIMVHALEQLGDHTSADDMLKNYEATIPQKTARYIQYCDIVAYTFWLRKDFDSAIDWASQGVVLKQESNVDTTFDCEHNLALAQRDAGDPATALKFFLNGATLPSVLDGAEGLEGNGAMYGNVGRCLQLIGENDSALVCYRASVKILERDTSLHSKSNRAYGRKWIGEVFKQSGDLVRAEAFMVDAIRVLGYSAPVRVREICVALDELRGSNSLIMNESRASQIVFDWIRE